MNHLAQTIINELDLRLEYWLASQQDRASTNSLALRKLKETEIGANQTRNDCCLHKFSNAGK